MFRKNMRYKMIYFLSNMVVVCTLYLYMEPCYSFYPGDETDWIKAYKVLSQNKLPLLDEEREKEILREVDRILETTKSWYLASKFLYEQVVHNEKGYLIYSNPEIRKRLKELTKMKIQCKMKEVINSSNISNEEKVEYCKKKLNISIQRDGELCLDCYIKDKEFEKVGEEIQKEYEEIDGYEPSPYIGNFFDYFYTATLSTFSPELYDYIWIARSLDLVPLTTNIEYLVLATINSERFLDDLCKSQILASKYIIYRPEGDSYPIEDVWKVIKTMLEVNPQFVEEKRADIKMVMMKCTSEVLNDNKNRMEELSKLAGGELLEENDTKYFPLMNGLCILDLRDREKMLSLYDKIGDNNDVGNIVKLSEDFLTYPVRRNSAYDIEERNKYNKKVEDFKSRVKILVEKLSDKNK